jgi:hypothetical protein
VPAGVQSPPFTMVEPHGGLLRIWRSNGKKDELHKRTETEGPYVKRSEGLFHSVEYLQDFSNFNSGLANPWQRIIGGV